MSENVSTLRRVTLDLRDALPGDRLYVSLVTKRNGRHRLFIFTVVNDPEGDLRVEKGDRLFPKGKVMRLRTDARDRKERLRIHFGAALRFEGPGPELATGIHRVVRAFLVLAK